MGRRLEKPRAGPSPAQGGKEKTAGLPATVVSPTYHESKTDQPHAKQQHHRGSGT